MAFMKRDVNLGLLLLIIVAIVLFTAFSVYYQTTFQDVSLEYQSKLDQLSQVTKELGAKRTELNETYSLRIQAEEDRKVLDSRYRDVSDENLRLETDKATLQTELSSTKSDLAEKSVELVSTKNLLSQTQTSLSAANGEITSLKSQRSNLKDDVERICDKLVAAGGADDDC